MITAKEFALEAHRNQMYGDVPYEVHLQSVVTILGDFGYTGRWEDAGWLHDTPEEPGVSEDELERLFGEWVRKTVHACYGVGKNRTARNASMYHRMAAFPEAAPLKIADRIAHVKFCTPGSSHAKLYLKERLAFRGHVAYRVPVMDRYLEEQYRRLM